MRARLPAALAALLLWMGGAASALPAQASIPGIRHEYEYQRLNNCGPVTVGMVLNRWGSRLTQYDIAPKLKSGGEDVNVSPEELAAFAQARGFRTHLGTAGSRTLLKRLLAAGFPVIVETWFVTPDSGGMGHYRLLTGYDDTTGTFAALDSYLGRLMRNALISVTFGTAPKAPPDRAPRLFCSSFHSGPVMTIQPQLV